MVARKSSCHTCVVDEDVEPALVLLDERFSSRDRLPIGHFELHEFYRQIVFVLELDSGWI